MATHIGKLKRVERVRNAIFNEMTDNMIESERSQVFLDREILFYILLEHGVNVENATYFTTKIYGKGRQITSRWLKEMFAGTSNEFSQNQFTIFINRYMKSGRIELLDKAPYIWRMNGFSTFQHPHIAGYKIGRKALKIKKSMDKDIEETTENKEKL